MMRMGPDSASEQTRLTDIQLLGFSPQRFSIKAFLTFDWLANPQTLTGGAVLAGFGLI